MVRLSVTNPVDRLRWIELEFLVDTGAIYSLIPRQFLEDLRIEPLEEQAFRVASGRNVVRKIGEARFRFGDRERTAPVIFGNRNDQPLLGVTTLEALGLEVDPVSEELRPATLLLM